MAIDGRLIRLRALEPEDAERAYRWINDRENVSRYLMARYPYSMSFEKEFMAEATKKNEFSEARFAIETKDGVHIGMCGLHQARPEDRTAELGIMIGEVEYQSRGYGSDAVLTLVTFGFETMNLNRVSLGTFEFNERAYAVYKKIGFVDEGREREAYYQDGRYWDILRMSVLRREFDALHRAAAVPATEPAPVTSVNTPAGA